MQRRQAGRDRVPTEMAMAHVGAGEDRNSSGRGRPCLGGAGVGVGRRLQRRRPLERNREHGLGDHLRRLRCGVRGYRRSGMHRGRRDHRWTGRRGREPGSRRGRRILQSGQQRADGRGRCRRAAELGERRGHVPRPCQRSRQHRRSAQHRSMQLLARAGRQSAWRRHAVVFPGRHLRSSTGPRMGRLAVAIRLPRSPPIAPRLRIA